MFKTEEIESWNKIFLNGKIQENDLKHPTELFVVRTLVAFLEKFGYKLEPPFPLTVESENTREKRLFLIRLAKVIDRILKYTDKIYACVYLDIIRPVPKRTALMFEILLNHYYYYDMFAGEVFKIEQEKFQQRNELIRNIDKLRRENANRKELALQMKDEISKLNIALPATTKEIEAYQSKTKQCKEELSQLKAKVEQLQQKLSNLRAREVFLQSQVVNDEEVSSFKIELKELHSNIAELDSQERSIQLDLNDCKEQSIKMECLLKCVEEIKKLMPAEQLQEYENIVKKLKENEIQHVNLKQEVDTLKNSINKLSDDIENLKALLKSKKQNLEQETRDQLAIISEKQKRFTEEKKLQDALKHELEDIQNSVDEQTEIYAFMLKSIDSLMADYKIIEK